MHGVWNKMIFKFMQLNLVLKLEMALFSDQIVLLKYMGQKR